MKPWSTEETLKIRSSTPSNALGEQDRSCGVADLLREPSSSSRVAPQRLHVKARTAVPKPEGRNVSIPTEPSPEAGFLKKLIDGWRLGNPPRCYEK